MNPLLAKEIRLILPAYAAALTLALGSVWPAVLGSENVVIFLLALGTLLLTLSSFGREFALNTFPVLLAQPWHRARTWWMKVGVLTAAVATVFAVWAGATFEGRHRAPTMDYDAIVLAGALTTLVVFAGGLWTTLLLRQVIAAFWLTLLVPLALVVFAGAKPYLVASLLGVYSAAGFLWAWRYFLRLEETAWTGGIVTLPLRRPADKSARSRMPAPRPWAALFIKELQLHQLGMVGIGLLFLLHLCILLLRRAGDDSLSSSTRSALEAFGGLWILAPFIIGGASVAEERKLGTADTLKSLPVPARIQFGIKLLFALVIGGLICPALLYTAEALGRAMGAPANIGGLNLAAGPAALSFLCILFSVCALVAFYASTTARNVVQALAIGLATMLAFWSLGTVAPEPEKLLGVRLWEGFLVYYLGAPAVAIALLWLCWRNFKYGGAADQSWRRNLIGLPGVLLAVGVLTTAIYHRAWERLRPVEPAHGQPQLSLLAPPKLASYAGSGLALVLPDGRLWMDRLIYEAGRPVLGIGDRTGFQIGGEWVSVDKNHFGAGSNWVDAAANFYETAAIRADGTLWVSQRPLLRYSKHRDGMPEPEAVPPLVQFETGSDWRNVVRDFVDEATSFVLLKKDGTLWRWNRRTAPDSNTTAPGLLFTRPYPLGTDSNWARMMNAGSSLYLWKTDGTAWALHPPAKGSKAPQVALAQETVLSRRPQFDNTKWTSMMRCWFFHVGVREDGTLWAWPSEPLNSSAIERQPAVIQPIQIGTGNEWLAVAGSWRTIGALKADGTLWKWELPDGRQEIAFLSSRSPEQAGGYSDWVAIGSLQGGVISLAADGSLWYWWPRGVAYDSPQPMLSAPRKPDLLGSVLAARKN